VGSYQISEYSSTYNSTIYYNVSVSKASYTDLYIANFYNAGISVRANLYGDKITIPWQIQDGYEIEGTGTIFGGQINLTYKVRDTYNNWETDFCNSSAVKQW